MKRLATSLSKEQIAGAQQAAQSFKPEDVNLNAPPARSSRKKGGGKEEPHEAGPYATGTGFYVTRDGKIVTNNHVVSACREMRIAGDTAGPAKILAVDAQRDLALLQGPHPVETPVVFRGDEKVRLGENIVVVGFPLTGILTSDAIVTTGIVSALAGPRDNPREMQISAPIQPGNSGGPLVDANGHVVGVIVSSLSTVRLAQATGAIPENINFAVKGSEASAFLKLQGITVDTAPLGPEMSTATIVERIQPSTLRLECWR